MNYILIDIWSITKRNLYRYIRLPQLLFFSTVQPVMFLLLFNFVFGNAIHVPGLSGKYINYLLPAILAQIVMFGAMQTGVGLAVDMSSGIIDRFRSLPMSRVAVLAGRTLSDLIRNIAVAIIMILIGYGLGFRFQEGFLSALGMIGIVLLFGYAFSWIMAFVGLSVKDSETAQVAGFPLIFPLLFASSAFVPVQTMPGWLQAFANNQPITHLIGAARYLTVGIGDSSAIWKALLWIVAILAIFVPLSVAKYRNST